MKKLLKSACKIFSVAFVAIFALSLAACSYSTGGQNESDFSDPLELVLRAEVPHADGYQGDRSNTKVFVTVNVKTSSKVKRVVYKKNGSNIADKLFSDSQANEVAATKDNAVWTFEINAKDENANATYSVAALDVAGRVGVNKIEINQFDFTPPKKINVADSSAYSSEDSSIILNWTEPEDSDYDHVEIKYVAGEETAESTASEPFIFSKGTLSATFGEIDGNLPCYVFYLTAFDSLGNRSEETVYKVFVKKEVSHVSEDFVKVPGGTYDGTVELKPQTFVFIIGRKITIRDLYVCDHEVTQKEYETYCTYETQPMEKYGIGDNYPAYFVSWYDAIVYCNMRSIAEGLTPVYTIDAKQNPQEWPGSDRAVIDGITKCRGPAASNSTWDAVEFNLNANGYRLPTDAEWEYVAREANTSSTTYSGSEDIDKVAWYTGNNDSKIHEVKTKEANGLGIYDMSGNLCEWCWDWNINEMKTDVPATGPASGTHRIYRGGSWFGNPYNCSVSKKGAYEPRKKFNDQGFRVVRNAE